MTESPRPLDRVVAIVALHPDGSRLGTGVLLDGERVLTAAHIVTGATRLRINRPGTEPYHEATVIAVGVGVDAALLRVVPAWSLPVAALRLGQPDGDEGVAWGFAAAAADEGLRPAEPLRGTVDLRRHAGRDGTSHVFVVRGGADAVEGWQGSSGGPVFVDAALAGLITNAQRQMRARLDLLPLDQILVDPALSTWLAGIAESAPAEAVRRIRVPGLRLLRNHRVLLAIAQTPRAAPESIAEDASRPESLAWIEALLSEEHPSSLSQIGNGGTSLIVLPEYALGSGDIAAVDAAVALFPGALVLYAGAGAVTGTTLTNWRDAPGPLGRELANLDRPAPLRRYNLGLLWLKAAGIARCVAVAKRFPEQRGELRLVPDLGFGAQHVVVELADADLHPMICADLVQATDDAPVAALRAAVRPESGRTQIVLAALLQPDPSAPAWRTALRKVTDTGALVVASNIAADVQAEPAEDAWRNLSGLFLPRARGGELSTQSSRAAPVSDELAGTLLRETAPCVVAGDLTVPPYGSTANGRWPWNAIAIAWRDDPTGLQSWQTPTSDQVELWRFVRQRCAALHPGLRIYDCVREISCPDVPRVLGLLLEGPRPRQDAKQVDFVTQIDHLERVEIGLEVLAALRIAGSGWAVGDSAQQQWPSGHALLVWHARERWSGVRNRLARLAARGLDRLVAVLDVRRDRVPDGWVHEDGRERHATTVRPDARTDVSAPAARGRRHVDGPEQPGSVRVLWMRDLAPQLIDPDGDPAATTRRWLDQRLEADEA